MLGYAITDQKKYLDFQLKKYELESLQDDRITVNVEVCGVCGSVRIPLMTQNSPSTRGSTREMWIKGLIDRTTIP